MEAFQIKCKNTLPALDAELTDENGAVDLTGATVEFVLFTAVPETTEDECETPRLVKGVEVLRAAGSVINAATGLVRYSWSSGDTDTEGRYFGEFVVTISGKKRAFPTVGFIPVSILPSLT